jgi:deubiquitinase DESI2
MPALSSHTRHAEKVFLNVYDLTPANDYLWELGLGVHHSGIQVHGSEWTFSSGGVFYHQPKGAPNVPFRKQVLLGTVNFSSAKVRQIVDSLRSDFQGESYHILNNNCNSFANALCVALLEKPIPGYVNRLAGVGSCFSCLIPKHMLGSSPVTSTGNSGGRSIQMSSFKNRSAGIGMRLGSSGSSQPSSAGANNDDLRKKRLAYLDRLQS